MICGHVARSKIRKSGGALRGVGFTTAGLILGYLMLALTAMGIPLLVSMIKSDVERTHRLSAERKEIVATDKTARFNIPGDWGELLDLNKKASVQAGNKEKGQYLLLISDAKADFADMTLEKHHRLTRDAMLKKMSNSSATDPVSVTIGGHPALQDEVTGTQSGMNIVFLHTTVDDGQYFSRSWPGPRNRAGLTRAIDYAK